jgi:S-DNA-T family DNA segregation ATPase FtsK/SpoIIIE
VYGKPIIKTLLDKGLVEIEVLSNRIETVLFDKVIDNLETVDCEVPLVLGKSYNGNDLIVDLASMPHLLIAGATGSGKSILLHSILSGLMKFDKGIRLALIDPKKVEFTYYNKIKHLKYPIITDFEDALIVLKDLVSEMENRFSRMEKYSVNNIKSFNEIKQNRFVRFFRKKEFMPYLVVIIDEFSDLIQTSKKDFQKYISLLAQKARACGIHIIIATQRPSADVVTGLIKANFPARISMRVSSAVDSRVILGRNGAEKLLGRGDAILDSVGHSMLRFQGSYITPREVQEICKGFETKHKCEKEIIY